MADLEAYGTPFEVSLSRTIRANNAVLRGHVRKVARERADFSTDLAAAMSALFSKDGAKAFYDHVGHLVRATQ